MLDYIKIIINKQEMVTTFEQPFLSGAVIPAINGRLLNKKKRNAQKAPKLKEKPKSTKLAKMESSKSRF